MLDEKGFDLWADGYDKSVEASDEAGSYPFAGYERVIGTIGRRVLEQGARTVLDLGFGTAALTSRLYEAGCAVFGQDFSPRMVELAQAKMPGARLFCGNLADGLVPELADGTYDAIVSTYALHHLDGTQKVSLMRDLAAHLAEGGRIYVGDVAFETRADLERCREAAGDAWDADEVYLVHAELARELPGLTFERLSPCAGLLMLGRLQGDVPA